MAEEAIDRARILRMLEDAQGASRVLSTLPSEAKRDCLMAMAQSLATGKDVVLKANARDLELARAAGISGAMLDRLLLDEKRIADMVKGLGHVAELADPVGEVLREWTTDCGLHLKKVRVPIGVICIIYEARPNVTAEAAALCLRSGNAVVLRGGKEASFSNQAIGELLQEGAKSAGVPRAALQVIASSDRDVITYLAQAEGLVDLIIPRGGEGLIRHVTEVARVPVIKHYKGICHLFVHDSADSAMAWKLVENSKCQRPGVCNALETLLVDKAIAAKFLPTMAESLRKRGVTLRGDSVSRQLVPSMQEATEEDWSTEYLDLILSVKIVDGLEEAIRHINRYGSHHTDTIVAEDPEVQERFAMEVDSAVVFINSSTRFTDGARFGMGAEMGISTDKLHARGPMALEELTTYKYIGKGDGLIVQ